jgi:mono/diheme cytochrome c family protein
LLKIDLVARLKPRTTLFWKPALVARLAVALAEAVNPTLFLATLILVAAVGCRQDMHDQPKYTPYQPAPFFVDQRSQRPPVEGTVPRGYLREDELLETGKINGEVASVFPFPIDEATLQRGRGRYDIYCSPCHSRTGDGSGMVVERGYRRPPSLHIDRLRSAPPGYIFDLITNGFGAMPDYASELRVRDRWAVAAYIRALQLSQYAPVTELPSDARGALP